MRNPSAVHSAAPQPSSHYPDSWTVQEAHGDFLIANGFSMANYTDPTFTVRVGPVPVTLLNTKGRRRALPRHDMHHLLTGYGSNWSGEAEVGIWELRTGCNSPTLWVINLFAISVGIFTCPSRVWRAFCVAKGQRSLFRDPIEWDALLGMTVGEARRRLGIPPDGLAS